MMCYRDMTFCPFWEECINGSECGRAYTDEVRNGAEEWMKNPPVAFFMEKPDCFKEKSLNAVDTDS